MNKYYKKLELDKILELLAEQNGVKITYEIEEKEVA